MKPPSPQPQKKEKKKTKKEKERKKNRKNKLSFEMQEYYYDGSNVRISCRTEWITYITIK